MTKDEIEQIYLEGVAKTLPKFPAGHLSKSENPDFLISNESGTLGIELTRIFRKPRQGESVLREQESLREQIVELAKARYDALGRVPIHVGVFFNDQIALRRRDVKPMATTLVDLAMRLMPDPGERREEEYNWVNREYFPEAVEESR
jgi:hypothetical protein